MIGGKTQYHQEDRQKKVLQTKLSCELFLSKRYSLLSEKVMSHTPEGCYKEEGSKE